MTSLLAVERLSEGEGEGVGAGEGVGDGVGDGAGVGVTEVSLISIGSDAARRLVRALSE
tara:strand:- start:3 stop:179 length:177 start_codon:yes stop_codon:yes gene_type:complete